MTKERKIDILYKRAKNQGIRTSPEEDRELRKYKVRSGENGFYVTKNNIKDYVTAVDKGCKISFYDWCCNNNRADKRRQGSDDASMTRKTNEQVSASVFVGWLTWGIAFYWAFGGLTGIIPCIIAGGVVSFILMKIGRRSAGFTVFLLPLILVALFSFLR